MEDVYRPSLEELEEEINKYNKRSEYFKSVRSTLYIFIIVAAFAVLCSTFYFCALEIQGGSMQPGLEEGQLVLTLKTKNIENGDVVAFYYNNMILIKRVIASPGQMLDIHADGSVYLDYVKIDEPYLASSLGDEGDIKFPYQVPDKRWFMLGDNREVSVDSRSSAVGTVSQEQLVGKVLWCVWPLRDFGPVN